MRATASAKAVPPKSLRERAYRAIYAKILSGELGPGATVSDLSLSRELQISRTPVREAVGQLASEGLLDQTSRGTIVRQLTRTDIFELYELREALEVYAVGKAAQTELEAADLDELERLCAEILILRDELEAARQRRLEADGMRRFVDADLRFHMVLLRTTGNRRIMKAVADSRLLMRIFSLEREGHDARQLEQIHEYHRGILKAVRRGDAAKATHLMAEHIRLSRDERMESHERRERRSQLAFEHPFLPDLDG